MICDPRQVTRGVLLSSCLLPALLAATSAFSAPPAAGQRGSAVTEMLADARLQKPVKLALKDQPLDEALKEVGKTLGVPLTADRTVSDDPVTYFCKERPATEVLPLVSRHFGFQWRRRGAGYQLWQDMSGRQREADLRAGEVRELLQRTSTHLERVAAASELTPAALAARQLAIKRALSSDDLSLAERRAVEEQGAALNMARSPFLGVHTLLRRLTPAQLRTLAGGDPVVFSTIDGNLSMQEGRRLASAASQGRPNKGTLVAVGILLKVEDPVGGVLEATDVVPTDILRPTPQIFGWISHTYETANGEKSTAGTRWEPYFNRMLLPEPQEPGDPRLTQEVTLVSKPSPRRMVPLSRVMEIIHKATGLPVVADSFIRARVEEAPLGGKKPLYKYLNYVSNTLNYRWELRDGILRLRSALYFRDRPREIPQRLREIWRVRLVRQGAFSLEDLSAITATLSDEQLRALTSYWYWQFEGELPKDAPEIPGLKLAATPVHVYLRRHDLRLWSSLNKAQRATARQGSLRLGALNGFQQRLALLSIVTPQHEPYKAVPPLNPEALAATTLSVTRREQHRQTYAVFTQDGMNSGGSQMYRPGEERPGVPALSEGDKMYRRINRLDWWFFQYAVPGEDNLTGERMVQIHYTPELVK